MYWRELPHIYPDELAARQSLNENRPTDDNTSSTALADAAGYLAIAAAIYLFTLAKLGVF